MFVWIILNYMTTDLTISMVEEILRKRRQTKIKVIIIDNASPNNSGQQIEYHFADNAEVDVIINSKNIGFAQGNNVGYKRALSFDPEFVIFSNNDVQIEDPDIYSKIQEKYRETRFSTLGPDILVPSTGIHQNPKDSRAASRDFVVAQVQKNRALLRNPFRLQLHALLKSSSAIRRFVVNRSKSNRNRPWQCEQKGVILHGAFFVVSESFMREFSDEAFYPKTFFYFEMEILSYQMREKKLLSLYTPSIQVKHLQNAATRESFHSGRDRLRFQAEQMVKSGSAFLDLIEEGKDNRSDD